MRIIPLAIVFALSSPSLGCAVRAGLANAPALGATPGAERRVHDVIANGNDSCERRAAGSPLRGRLPPCASEGTSPPPTSLHAVVRKERHADGWLSPVHLRWPSCAMTFGQEDPFTSRVPRSESWMACADETP